VFRESGVLVGFSVLAGPQAEAEFFCRAMPMALGSGVGKALVERNKVAFVHPKEGTCRFEVPEEDARALDQLFKGEGLYRGQKLSYQDASILTPGFKYTLAGKEDAGEACGPYKSI